MPISYRAAQSLIKRGDEAGLAAALDKGLDPSLTNENGWSLLMLAAVEGAVPLGRLLIDRGADLAARNHKGLNAQEIATNRGFQPFAELLQN
jgi:ankyrin repeat protein